jgi:hypothetical protein
MNNRVAMWQRCTMHFTRAHLVEMIPGGVEAWMWMVLIRILVSIRNSLLASPHAPHMCQMQFCTLLFDPFREVSPALLLQ